MLRRALAAVPAALGALSICSATPAEAQKVNINGDSVAFIIDRQPLRRAAYSIVTTDGESALLLTDTTIIVQLTDAGLNHLDREITRSTRNDSVPELVGHMVAGALKPFLNHGIAYNLRDLGDAKYTDGRLDIRRKSGETVFGHLDMYGHDVMESFSADDAREFARRAKAAAQKVRSLR